MPERVDGNSGFANLRHLYKNKNFAIESPRKAQICTRKKNPQLFHFTTEAERESKLSLESVKSIIKPEEMLSKCYQKTSFLKKLVRITRQKQWFRETEALPPQGNA